MLNGYFAFGVPLFLLFLYVVFAIIRKKSTFHYIGFLLLLIASFMSAFSFQVLQGFWSLSTSKQAFSDEFSYNPNWLWLPFFLGMVLAGINLFRGIRKLLIFSKKDSVKDKK